MTALSAVETEQVREIRARLNRVPKGQPGDKSVGPLSKGFFDVAARVGLPAAPAGAAPPAPAEAISAAAEADMAELARLVGQLAAFRSSAPDKWRPYFDAGVMQAILTRRLVLGGKERI